MKALETEPVSQEESNRAAGMGSYVPPKKFEIRTLANKDALIKMYDNKNDTMITN
jgi:hypothetical protein